MAKYHRFTALFLMLFSMFLLGGISNTKGIVLAEVRYTLGMNLSQLGLVVFVFQWGFVLASFFTGYYSDKYGIKRMILLGSAVMALGMTGTGLTASLLFFLGFYLIVGLGLGAMTVASNAIVPIAFPKKQIAMFNIAMGVYGVGMLVTPLILNLLFREGISWRFFYLGTAALIVLFIFYTFWVAVPEGKVEKISLRAFATMLKDSQFLLIMFFLIFYVSCEVTFTNFLPSYIYSLDLHNATLRQKQTTVTTIMAAFSILFTIGRLLGGVVNDLLGGCKTLVLFSIAAFAILLLSKLLAETWVYGFALTGLGLSVLFPTATGMGTRVAQAAGSALGLVYVAAGIGGASAGWLVGYVSHTWGSSAGFNLPIAFLAILIVLALWIQANRRAGSAIAP